VTRAKKVVSPMTVIIITERCLRETRRRPGPFFICCIDYTACPRKHATRPKYNALVLEILGKYH